MPVRTHKSLLYSGLYSGVCLVSGVRTRQTGSGASIFCLDRSGQKLCFV